MGEILEYLFTKKDPESFVNRIKVVSAEISEIYDNENITKLYEYQKGAQTYLHILYGHILRYLPEDRNSKKMLALIYDVLNNGEYKFLLSGFSEDMIKAFNKIINAIKKEGNEKHCLQMAAEYVFYYFNAYEKRNHTYKEKIEIEELYNKISIAGMDSSVEEHFLEEESSSSNNRYHVDKSFPIKLYERLNDYVIGHEQMKQELSMVVYRLLQGERRNYLIMGPTGTGKNYTIEVLQRFLREETNDDVVLWMTDVSRITPAGFQGGEIETEIIKPFKQKFAGIPYSKAIIVLNEIDKIVHTNRDAYGDNVSQFVQESFLTLLDNTDNKMKNVSYIIIMLGAFNEFEEIEVKKKNAVGFGIKNNNEYDIISDSELNLRENLKKIGGLDQFIGRISLISRLDKLNREELKKILLHKNGIIAEKKRLFDLDGVELIFKDSVIDTIVEKAYNQNLGARALINVVEAIVKKIEFKLLYGYDKIVIHDGVVDRGEQPLLYKKGVLVNEEVS